MKEYIQSYHVFLPNPLLKWIIYLLYPLLFLLFYIIVQHPLFTEFLHYFSRLLIFFICTLVLGIELFLDFFIFGGISSKDTNKMEYLKTSFKGIRLLRNALMVDSIRRGLSLTLMIGITICSYFAEYTLTDGFEITFLIFTMLEIALIVERHFSSLTAPFLAYSICSIVLPVCLLALEFLPAPVVIILLILIGITASYLNRWLILRKARYSYYDN